MTTPANWMEAAVSTSATRENAATRVAEAVTSMQEHAYSCILNPPGVAPLNGTLICVGLYTGHHRRPLFSHIFENSVMTKRPF